MGTPQIFPKQIWIYNTVNSWSSTELWVVQITPETQPRQKSSIPYLKMKIQDPNSEEYIAYIECAVPEFSWPRPRRISNRLFQILITKTTFNVLYWSITNNLYLFIIVKFIYMLNFPVSASPSCAFVKDPFTQNFTTITAYFYIFRYYSTYSRRWGSFGYHDHDLIYFYARFHQANLKQDPSNSLTPKLSW